jgi:peptide/nickel transport system permease protein
MAEQPLSLTSIAEAGGRVVRDVRRRGRALPASPVRWRTVGQVLPLVLFLVLVLVGPLVLPSPVAQNLSGRVQPPMWLGGGDAAHPLGTDGLGRDLLSRLALGGRLSLLVSAVAATGAGALGVMAGVLAGMRGGLTDRVITMLVETLLAIPFITVGIVVTATVGQSTSNLVGLLVLSGWITHARIVRLQVQALARVEFITAARSLGAGSAHVARRHLLPNLWPVIVVVLFQQAGAMMLWSASLTYLGIGMPVDEVTLGGIVREGQELIYNAWWVSVFGGVAIAWAVGGLNLFADWIQRRIDPTLR